MPGRQSLGNVYNAFQLESSGPFHHHTGGDAHSLAMWLTSPALCFMMATASFIIESTISLAGTILSTAPAHCPMSKGLHRELHKICTVSLEQHQYDCSLHDFKLFFSRRSVAGLDALFGVSVNWNLAFGRKLLHFVPLIFLPLGNVWCL